MKICHLITRMIQGGAQENTLLTLQGLKRDTPWEVHFACGPEFGEEGSLLEEARATGAAFRPLRWLRRDIHPLHDWLAYAELVEYFTREQFDLVHTHSSKAGILGRLAARRAGVSRILHTIHGLAFDEFQTPWKNRVYAEAERLAADHCDCIVAVCDTMAERAVAAGAGNRTMMRTIYSGFDLNPFLAVKPRPFDGKFVVGMISRMFEHKGHEDLMALAPRVFQRWDDVNFLLLGDGPMRRDWRSWMEAHPAWKDRFHFAGRVPPAEVASQIARMDMALHLSRREGLARVIPQALAAGRPVCVYDVGGAREVVRNNETGWMVAPNDLDGVMAAIASVKTNPLQAEAMAARGRERVHALFATETMQRRIADLYRELATN